MLTVKVFLVALTVLAIGIFLAGITIWGISVAVGGWKAFRSTREAWRVLLELSKPINHHPSTDRTKKTEKAA